MKRAILIFIGVIVVAAALAWLITGGGALRQRVSSQTAEQEAASAPQMPPVIESGGPAQSQQTTVPQINASEQNSAVSWLGAETVTPQNAELYADQYALLPNELPPDIHLVNPEDIGGELGQRLKTNPTWLARSELPSGAPDCLGMRFSILGESHSPQLVQSIIIKSKVVAEPIVEDQDPSILAVFGRGQDGISFGTLPGSGWPRNKSQERQLYDVLNRYAKRLDLKPMGGKLIREFGAVDSTQKQAPIPISSLNDGLVAYFPFNGNANDASGKAYNGTVYGATYVIDGSRHTVLTFNGINNYVFLPQLPTFGSGEFSIFAWIKSDASNANGDRKGIIGYGQATQSPSGFLAPNQSLYFFLNNDDTLGFDLADTKGPISAKSVGDGKWHDVGVIYINGNVQLYIDGVSDGASVFMNPNIAPGYQTIGAWFGNGRYNCFFRGNISSVGIWSRSLSAGEIKALYSLEIR